MTVTTPAPAPLSTVLLTPAVTEPGLLSPVLTGEDIREYFAVLDEAVDHVDPGPGARDGWEARERLRISTWVRQAYANPLSGAVFSHGDQSVARAVQHAQAVALGERLDRNGNGARPARPTAHVRASAAVGVVWSITADAVAQNPRPPRERVVADVWTVVCEIIAPALVPSSPGFVRARGAW